jgi:hypothetical protein
MDLKLVIGGKPGNSKEIVVKVLRIKSNLVDEITL